MLLVLTGRVPLKYWFNARDQCNQLRYLWKGLEILKEGSQSHQEVLGGRHIPRVIQQYWEAWKVAGAEQWTIDVLCHGYRSLFSTYDSSVATNFASWPASNFALAQIPKDAIIATITQKLVTMVMKAYLIIRKTHFGFIYIHLRVKFSFSKNLHSLHSERWDT